MLISHFPTQIFLAEWSIFVALSIDKPHFFKSLLSCLLSHWFTIYVHILGSAVYQRHCALGNAVTINGFWFQHSSERMEHFHEWCNSGSSAYTLNVFLTYYSTVLFSKFVITVVCSVNLVVLVKSSIAMKRHYDYGSCYVRKHFIGAWLAFRGLVHCHHGGKHNSLQVDMVRVVESYTFRSVVSRKRDGRKKKNIKKKPKTKNKNWAWHEHLKPQSWWQHTSSNKAFIPSSPYQVMPLSNDQKFKSEPMGVGQHSYSNYETSVDRLSWTYLCLSI